MEANLFVLILLNQVSRVEITPSSLVWTIKEHSINIVCDTI